MDAFKNYVLDEWTKLLSKKQLKVMLGLSLIISLGFGLIKFYLLQQTNSAFLETTVLSLTTVQFMSGLILPIFMIALGSELIISEFADGTIKNILSLPLSRATLFMGKLASGILAVGAVILTLMVPTFLADVILQGIPSAVQLGSFFIGLMGTFLYCSMILIMANALAIWTKSAGSGMLIGIVTWIAMGPIGLYFNEIGRFLPNHFDKWYMPLIQGNNGLLVLGPLCFMLSYGVFFALLGLYKFNTKEV